MRRPAEFADHPMPYPDQPEWRGFCKYVVDGDTLDIYIDQGFNGYTYEVIRLRGVDAWELRGDELEKGQAARTFVQDLLLHQPCRIVTYKDRQSFGRYEADVWYMTADGWRSLADTLVEAGHAVPSSQ